MSITDELREYANTRISPNKGMLTAIADRIDAKHQKAEDEWRDKNGDMWLKGYNVCHKELMEGHPVIVADLEKAGWVRLPVDADGVPIHLGDEVYQVKGGWVYTVKAITFYPDNVTVSFAGEHGFGCDSVHSVHHYHEPTVEDLLFSYGQSCIRISNEAETDAAKQTMLAKLREEYAAKLRLADDEKGQQ